MMPTGKASGNAVLAKARALYGSRLRADDYRRLMACRTMTELAAALKEYPLYSEAAGRCQPPVRPPRPAGKPAAPEPVHPVRQPLPL